ncbi:hypothetical protein QTO30_03845 [Yoonia sp. GPGPB17]|uniref:hypothetical protein n=1 Tax=Yoonia sp. GPGPB17 TaxID=3026147 RepID=UPI0030BD5FCB
MPIERLIFILVLVMALAAATIAVVLAMVDAVSASPITGLAILSLIALCASFAWRWFIDRKRDNTSGE